MPAPKKYPAPKTGKIVTLAELSRIRKNLPNTVLAGGAFDILHMGHVAHIMNAKSKGDTLIVHVVGNKRVREKRGPGKPVMHENERAHLIAALSGVDYVFIYNGRHYDQQVIKAVRPDVLFFNVEGYTEEVRDVVSHLTERPTVFVDKARKINSSSKIIESLRKK